MMDRQIDRRTVLRVGAWAAIGFVTLTAESACPFGGADNSQTNGGKGSGGKGGRKTGSKDSKPRKGHGGQPTQPHPDDGRRYRCAHPSHKRPYIIFGSAGVSWHVLFNPSHKPYIVRYYG